MGLVAAIVGLAVLVMIHEAGHFFAARAVGMTPRKFYLGFGPPIVKKTRGNVEYGIGSLPLGGYVKIPGMNRPSPGTLAATLSPEQREQHADALARLDAAIERGDDADALETLRGLKASVGETRYLQELEWSFAPDAYWRQATWRRLVAIGAGPAVNIVTAVVLFTALLMVATSKETNKIATVGTNTPASSAGIRPGDRILAIAGVPVKAKDIPKSIRATDGAPFRMRIRRAGSTRVIGPLSARKIAGAYRIGIGIQAAPGPGESFPNAAKDSFALSWGVTADTVRGLAHLATGRGTDQVSSSVGIVRAQQQAWRQGLRDFLSVLGLISLALGLLNLLPVLPLDGGHIVIALLEKLRGRTFTQTVYVRYSVVGLAIFAILMYFGLRNDLFGSGG